jgi:hypothetical protein
MAEESKSWFPNIGILSESSLLGIPSDMQDQLQREASKRMLIGGLLSGRPDIGFQSAIGTANDYAASQQRLMDLAEKQRQLQEESAWTAKYNPTKYQETSPEFAGPVAPDVSAYQSSIGRARAAGLPTADVNAALRDLTTMRSPRQAAMLEGFKASLPKMGEGGTMLAPSGQYLGTVPQFSPSQNMIYGADVTASGQFAPYSMPIPNGEKGRAAATAAETRAREENTYRDITTPSGGKSFAFPSEIRGGAIGGAGGAGGTGGGLTQTASDIAKNKAAEEDYVAFSKTAYENAQTAPTRKQSAEFLYSAADKMDPNAATPFFAETAGYLRVIPGVGDKYDSFVGDYKLMNQTRAKNILSGFQSIKGNANPQEVKIAEDAANNPVKDPKWTTKWISALEIAASDKDLAKENWKSNYQGEARKATTTWQNSPDNPRVYNHPKVEQFIREQISENPARPVLPAGFKLVQSGDKYGVKKPDGSVMPLQLGQ